MKVANPPIYLDDLGRSPISNICQTVTLEPVVISKIGPQFTLDVWTDPQCQVVFSLTNVTHNLLKPFGCLVVMDLPDHDIVFCIPYELQLHKVVHQDLLDGIKYNSNTIN